MYTIFAPVHPVLSKQNAPRRHPYGRHLWGGAFNNAPSDDQNAQSVVNAPPTPSTTNYRGSVWYQVFIPIFIITVIWFTALVYKDRGSLPIEQKEDM